MKKYRLLSLLCACLISAGSLSAAVMYADESEAADTSASDSALSNDAEFSITYLYDGGTGKIESPEGPFHVGDVVTLSLWALRKDGYSHTGWTDGVNNYKRGVTISMPRRNVVLRPIWKPVYSITYEKLEPYGYDSPYQDGTVSPGTEIKLLNLPMHNGDAQFEGWLVNGKFYPGNSSFIMPEQDTKVEIYWLEPVEIDYFAGDVEGLITNPHYIVKAFPGYPMDFSNGERLVRLGYKLTGWIDPDDGQKYTFADSYITPEANKTYLADWTPVKVSMKFTANGGSGRMTNQIAEFDSWTEIKKCEYTREGYKLAGWKHDDDYYLPGAPVQARIRETGEFMVFDAVWIEENRNPGDINGDGIVDLSDLAVLGLHTIGDLEITDEQALDNADVQRDGTVDISDAALLKQFLSKEKILLGIGE